ncbi:MAG: hypothetical protein V4548_02490 [Bacteroidota bacterium]
MKNRILILLVFLGTTTVFGQQENKAQYTGDNFSLEGALALFEKATSLEEFEKMLNEENNNVNNLDLNGDGNIDYITVSDIKEKDSHTIVLSIDLSPTEKQDIATIGIEKTGKEQAVLQIEGDEKIYAANTIVEPSDEKQMIKNAKGGPSVPEIESVVMIVNVWAWPSVQFLYAPGYVVWVSPHRWAVYPNWWKPWKPIRYSIFRARCAPHRLYYHHTPEHRVLHARKIYTPRRNSSTLVIHNRRGTTVMHKNKRGKVGVVKVRRGRRR